MAVNPSLFIAAPMLQDYIVDKTLGTPLANGLVTLYKDTSRQVLKNWYYQTGTPGAYTYVPLDNPMNLSSVGTIQDPNGNDVIPFFYPFNEDNENEIETYYITVDSVDEDGQPALRQFTRENFPYIVQDSEPSSNTPTLRNYILNNVYWRNAGSQDLMNVTDMIIAPSQHDGYTNGDIRFIKDVTGANDDLAFTAMTTTLTGDITPEYYIDMQCSGATVGETVKCIQYPISLHVKTLQNVQFSLKLYAQNIGGSENNYLDLYIYQYTGTGALSASTLTAIGAGRITLNGTMQKFVISDIFPEAATNLGAGGDDAFFLRIQFPLNATFHIGHTKPQIYLSEVTDVPDNDFDTYDQIETIINSSRTGDIRTSLNSFQPFGWVIANDGVISNSGSFTPPSNIPVARRNIDTWPLFNLIWNNVNATFAPMYDSAGAPAARGLTAIADWNATKQMQLTRVLGRIIQGLPTSGTFTYNNGTGNLTVADASLYYVGSPVLLSNSGGALPSAFTAGTVYYAIPVSSTDFQLATSYANALNGTAITGGTGGTGTNTVSFALGGWYGESRHTQLTGEVGAHSHVITAPRGQNHSAPLDQNVLTNDIHNGTVTSITAANNTPAGNPFNIVSPAVYYNVFIKL